MPRSKASDWRTPRDPVIELLHLMWDGKPEIDPCASVDPAHHFAKKNLHPEARLVAERDGLAAAWRGATAFVNPPFDQLALWAEKCATEARLNPGLEVVLLLPVRSDTRYWHDHVRKAAAICFWKGRLTFEGAPACAPFPVAFAYFGRRPWLFHQAFSQRGMIVAP